MKSRPGAFADFFQSVRRLTAFEVLGHVESGELPAGCAVRVEKDPGVYLEFEPLLSAAWQRVLVRLVGLYGFAFMDQVGPERVNRAFHRAIRIVGEMGIYRAKRGVA